MDKKNSTINLYDPKTDFAFQKPYIDTDEWKQGATRYRYVHGGFEGTDLRFAFYFPEEHNYKGRFFHFMCPVPGNENAAMAGDGAKITFAVKNGAYFVESNMGVTESFGRLEDPTIIYRASAAVAEYSREVAQKFYGGSRPYGYIYGGSGGGYKTISCIENTKAWDGAVPFVIGSSMSVPYAITCASYSTRVLRNKLHLIVDAMEPGGSKNPYEHLNQEEADAFREITRFGVPHRGWFSVKPGADGSLPVLAPAIKAMDPEYFTDFWTKPGYLGSDKTSSAVRDRLQHKSKVCSLIIPEGVKKQNWEDRTGVDDAWQRLMKKGGEEKISLYLETMPEKDAFTHGAVLKITSGAMEGQTLPIEKIECDKIILGGVFGADDFLDDLDKVKPGDELMLDNSDYLALQLYHRHQIPAEGYEIYDQYRDENGKPIYPQRAFLFGPQIALGGAGSLQSGRIQAKTILIAALLDGNLPWKAHWYSEMVRDYVGKDEHEQFRLWYVDNAVHSDEMISGDELHIAGYFGVLHQALLDVSDWVEGGIAPALSTSYRVEDGQIIVAEKASERFSIQPVITMTANGSEHAQINKGNTVQFIAKIELPPGAGTVTKIEWSFEGESDYPYASEEVELADTMIIAKAVHQYNQSGTYFPVVKVSVNRNGDAEDVFTQVKNLCRGRVTVAD